MSTLTLALLLAACSEYRVDDGPRVPPADPPPSLPGLHGSPPDWNTCGAGYAGRYHNLGPADPMVGVDAEPAPEHPDDVDWWAQDTLTFTRFDPSLDFGANWWPVDEGIEDDPAYYTVTWAAWVRVHARTSLQILLGAADDAWVLRGDEVVASVRGAEWLEAQVFAVDVSPGQYPLTVRYAHRAADEAGLRFRVVGGDVTVCYPDYAP